MWYGVNGIPTAVRAAAAAADLVDSDGGDDGEAAVVPLQQDPDNGRKNANLPHGQRLTRHHTREIVGELASPSRPLLQVQGQVQRGQRKTSSFIGCLS